MSCRPTMDVRGAGLDEHVFPFLIPATTCWFRPRRTEDEGHESGDDLTSLATRLRRRDAIRRCSAGAKYDTIRDAIDDYLQYSRI